MPIPKIQPHGARTIECECPQCHFVIRDPRCAVLIDDFFAITCPKCDWHSFIDCQFMRKEGP
jgi:hypothetical protein